MYQWLQNNWYALATLVLAVVGWFAAYKFGLKQQINILKENWRMKVFEIFWKKRENVSSSIIIFSTQVQQFSAVIIVMNSFEKMAIIGEDLNREQEGKENAIRHFREYVSELERTHSLFNDEYLSLWRMFETWMHVMPRLDVAFKTLISEYRVISEQLQKHIDYVSILDGTAWHSWDHEHIKELCNFQQERLMDLLVYTEDMMGLIHDELIGSMFGYRKKLRVPLDERCKVLTKTGLVSINKK
jgi:hypothetical protein